MADVLKNNYFLEDFIMAEVTFRTIECPHWIPARVSYKTVQTLEEVTKRVRRIKCDSPYLSQLLYDLNENLKSENSALWLKENRKELRNSVYLMSELDPISTDSSKLRTEKLIIGAKLIEIIEA